MNSNTIVHLIHMFITGPFILYVALAQPSNPYVYWAMIALGILVSANFSYKAFTTSPISQRHVWFALHALVFSSLLIYVGYMGANTPHIGYSLLLAVGIAAIGYHLVRLVQEWKI